MVAVAGGAYLVAGPGIDGRDKLMNEIDGMNAMDEMNAIKDGCNSGMQWVECI